MRASRCSLAALIGLAAACGDPAQPVPPRPALAIVSGQGQTDTVVRWLKDPVVAEATDSVTKLAVPQIIVNWFTIRGADTVFEGASLTDAAGKASFRWKLAPGAGPQAAIAWAFDAQGNRLVYALAQATALPDTAAAITLARSQVQLWLNQPLRVGAIVVGVADPYGNAIASAQPSWQAPAAWKVTADTVRASGETRDTLRLALGSAKVSLVATALRDLRASAWATAYACGDTAVANAGQVRYRVARGVVDSLRLDADTNGYRLYETVTWIQYWNDRSSTGGPPAHWDTTTAAEQTLLASQAPGQLAYDYSTGVLLNGGRQDWASTGTWNGTAYVGGNRCAGQGWDLGQPSSPFTLTPTGAAPGPRRGLGSR